MSSSAEAQRRGDAEETRTACTVCGRPAVAFTLVPTRDEGGQVTGRIMLCERHEREADRRFRAMLREMVAEGAAE